MRLIITERLDATLAQEGKQGYDAHFWYNKRGLGYNMVKDERYHTIRNFFVFALAGARYNRHG